MSRVILALLLLVAVASAFPQDLTQTEICGFNEVYNYCGSACEPTCAVPKAKFCTYQCIQGCFCRPGYLRNYDNLCVHPYQC